MHLHIYLRFLRVGDLRVLILRCRLLFPMMAVHKTGAAHCARIALIVFVFIFTFTLTSILIAARDAAEAAAVAARSHLSEPIVDALLHFASADAVPAARMSSAEMAYVESVLRRCAAPCNLLIFGLSHETLLWNALNHGGRTVFVDERSFLVEKLEEEHPSIEAYDVRFSTKVSEFRDLIQQARSEIRGECRPVQNLLFSDCVLAVNDLPNHIYAVAWDVILVDGPAGFSPDSPGRMATIFTAAILARSRSGGGTHVLVHEIEREAERVCSELFLCRENLVEKIEKLGDFVVGKMEDTSRFCSTSSSSSDY